MATTLVVDLIDRAQTILQDTTGTRWPRDELLGWLNDAQLAVVNRRPDAHTKNAEFICVAGTRQDLPADGIRLMKVVRNSDGSAIRPILMRILDDQIPNWHEEVGALAVDHYAYDNLDPKVFYLYPAPATATKVDIVYTVAPTAITISDWDTDTTTTITLDDSYLNPILDFILHRAYQKDSDYSSNAQRAQGHFQAFLAALGDKTEADAVTAGGA